MMILGTDPQITFGDLDLYGDNEYNGIGFTLSMLGDDYTFGAPQPVDVWIKSLLADGSLVVTESHDNREVSLRLTIEADDSDGLQAGEEALFLTCSKPTTFTWRPPDETAATTVFEVITSHLEHIQDDDLDERRYTRTYGLTMTCMPWTRSVDAVTVATVPTGAASPVATVIDECTATTGFTSNHTLSVYSGTAVRDTMATWDGTEETFWIQRAGSVTITQPYIRIKIVTTFDTSVPVLKVDGTNYNPVSSSGGNYWYAVPAGTYSTIRVTVTYPAWSGIGRPYTGSLWLSLYSIYQTNTANFGTQKELAQTLEIAGSARTAGDITVSNAAALGDVILYTYPPELTVYAPGLAQFRTSGGTQTADTACVSGQRELLSGNPTYTIPQNLIPKGTYQLLARVRNNATGYATITWGIAFGSITKSGTCKVNFPVANQFYIVALDTLELPPTRFRPESESAITLTLQGAATTTLDMPWVFHTDGELTIVSAGTEKTLEVDAPDLEQPGGMVWIGDHYPENAVIALGRHEFQPPRLNLYVATTDVNDSACSATYYPRWFTHAAQ